MTITDILGLIGCLLFFIKIGLHFYIKSSVDSKVSITDIGQYTNLSYFFPVFDKVSGNMKTIKLITNLIYILAVLMIITFVIGLWTGNTSD